jgi:hypothetical protein
MIRGQILIVSKLKRAAPESRPYLGMCLQTVTVRIDYKRRIILLPIVRMVSGFVIIS